MIVDRSFAKMATACEHMPDLTNDLTVLMCKSLWILQTGSLIPAYQPTIRKPVRADLTACERMLSLPCTLLCSN